MIERSRIAYIRKANQLVVEQAMHESITEGFYACLYSN